MTDEPLKTLKDFKKQTIEERRSLDESNYWYAIPIKDLRAEAIRDVKKFRELKKQNEDVIYCLTHQKEGSHCRISECIILWRGTRNPSGEWMDTITPLKDYIMWKNNLTEEDLKEAAPRRAGD